MKLYSIPLDVFFKQLDKWMTQKNKEYWQRKKEEKEYEDIICGKIDKEKKS